MVCKESATTNCSMRFAWETGGGGAEGNGCAGSCCGAPESTSTFPSGVFCFFSGGCCPVVPGDPPGSAPEAAATVGFATALCCCALFAGMMKRPAGSARQEQWEKTPTHLLEPKHCQHRLNRRNYDENSGTKDWRRVREAGSSTGRTGGRTCWADGQKDLGGRTVGLGGRANGVAGRADGVGGRTGQVCERERERRR